jgi:hypothetical protein
MFYSATKRRGIVSKLIYFGEILYIFHKKDYGNNKNKAEERIQVFDHRNWLSSESHCFL